MLQPLAPLQLFAVGAKDASEIEEIAGREQTMALDRQPVRCFSQVVDAIR
jgi:hypothetical protein